MINIAFCFELDSDLNFMVSEVTECFNKRGLCISTRCYHNATELKNNVKKYYPDILFYEMNKDSKEMCKVALEMKKLNPELVYVVTGNNTPFGADAPDLIEPVFTIPNKSRRQLWNYASLAYEATLKDNDSFSYYRRPNYIHTPVDDIQYFASDGRRIALVTSEGEDIFYKKMDEVEQLVKNKCCQFLRIHQSFLVNIKYITGYNRRYVKLSNGEQLNISNYRYYKNINETLKLKPTY